jgi:hypothetical protein
MTDITLREVIAHPATLASTVVAFIGGILNIPILEALIAVLWAKAGSLFTVLSIGGFTLGPRVPMIPEGPLTTLAIIAGVLYGVKVLYGVVQNFEERV